MKIRKLLIVALALASASALGAYSDDNLSAIDSDGNRYNIVNYFDGNHEVIRIMLTEKYGNLIWDRIRANTYDDKAVDVATDPDKNLIVAAVRRVRGHRALVLFKYDRSGLQTWERIYDDELDNNPSTVAVAPSGDIYVGGTVRQNGRTIARIWRFGVNSELYWCYNYDQGTSSRVKKLAVDINNNLNAGIVVTNESGNYGEFVNRSVTYGVDGSILGDR